MENISATGPNGKTLRLFTREQLEREARTQAILLGVAAGLNAASASIQASQPTTTVYSGGYAGSSTYAVNNRYGQNVGNIYGRTSGSIYGSSVTTNPAATAAANQAIQANTAANFQAIEAGLAGQLAAAQGVFATTTLFPNTGYSGVVIVKKADEVNLTFRVNGDTHVADFKVK